MTASPATPTDDGLPWAESIAPGGTVSAPVFAQNVAAVAEYRGTAEQIDAAFEEDGLVATAEVIAGIMWAGLSREVPHYDDRLIAVLERDGRPVAVPFALSSAGYIVETFEGRLGVTAGGRGTIESTGDAIALAIGPPAGRYRRAWKMPHVEYAWTEGEE